MKNKKIYTKLMLAGTLFLTSAAFTSCEDFLTVIPTDSIPEESFWQDRNDLDNVRAGAYHQLSQAGQTEKMVIWGELRSDNLTLNNMSNSFITYLQDAVLQPSEGAFDWGGFYRGINYCNLVLEQGEKMTTPGKEVDPSFGRTDWAPIRTEMLSLRALYYFYLVRAYRNVPYVTYAVRDDAAAREDMPAATPGVAILGRLIQELEDSVKYGATNYGNTADNKGRFTKTSTHMLLADMYLWRGCMLRNFMEKAAKNDEPAIVNIDDIAVTAEGGATSYTTKNGTAIDAAYTKELANECFEKAIQHCDFVLSDVHEQYAKDSLMAPTSVPFNKKQPYPLYRVDETNAAFSMRDEPGYYNNYRQNSRESVFELQYDGTTTTNSTISNYFSNYSNGAVTPAKMVINNALIANAGSTYNPAKGYGKSDMRLIENCNFTSIDAAKPLQKYLTGYINFPNWEDVTENPSVGSYRTPDNTGINWNIYRLSDAMLIKAEAIARSNNDNPSFEAKKEAYQLVNQIFARSNPALRATVEDAGDKTELVCSRMQLKDEYMLNSDKNGFVESVPNLLQLIYQERQREFLCEGKRWFDIVRQVEASNDSKNTLTNFITVTNSVKNRLSKLYSFYNPIYSEELKVNGAEVGGKLVQNPVWDRYTKK